MPGTVRTFERVDLRQRLLESAHDDVRAAERNSQLLDDLKRSLKQLHSIQRNAGRAQASATQLDTLRTELAEVQARREQARADFEVELRATISEHAPRGAA